jgi:hypothetical protein
MNCSYLAKYAAGFFVKNEVNTEAERTQVYTVSDDETVSKLLDN